MKSQWIAALLVVLAVSAHAEPSEWDWLDRMARAGESLYYSGTFVYRRDAVVSAARLMHVGGERPADRIQALDGSYWELRRDAAGPRLLVPADSPVGSVASPFGGNFASEVPRRLRAMRGLYRITEGGKDRVAGRVVQQLDVVPADPYRYGLRLAVDVNTGLLLRVALLGRSGALTEMAFFTLVEYPEDEQQRARAAEVIAESPPVAIRSYSLDVKLDGGEWAARWLPPGYTLRAHSINETLDAGTVEHMMFSDGLSAVSVFIEPSDPSQPAITGPLQAGGVGAYAATVTGYQVMVMGDVPELTLRMIGENLAPAGSSVRPAWSSSDP